ncbi:MAG: DUF927 domain-containing protein [Desulfovibrionaceae bacterium]|uniref:DUF927 domain-containing protein n=1 Tax=uncultured Lactobacillus sp. TaxID=153152 RepID=UPI0023C0ADCE|nr:DUF927 domain-containing protein [uncultured Lactobacillus sp.]MDE7065820.1 DUF927 domain-containing protein [Desulfovibrionaceae bacterium]
MRSGNSPELRRRVLDALASAGLVVDGAPDCSGELMTCGTTKKPSGTDGRYAVHLDWPPNVWLCNYHEGGEGRTVPLWTRAERDAMPQAEREALRERIRQEKEEAAQRLEKRHRKAAEAANRIFRPLPPAGEENAYLSRKGVLPLGDLRQESDGRLVVPVLNAEGRIVSLQRIAVDGSKLLLPGGEKKGCFFPVPARDSGTDGPLLIGEGVATVLSVCLATGHAGLVAVDCGNLEAVARVAREKYPEREIILCADNDCETGGNPGVTRATAAARSVGGTLAVCPAHEGRATDFNDLHQWRGPDAVRAVIEKARDASPVHLPDGFFIRESGRNPGLFKRETKGEESFDLRIGPPLRIIGKTSDNDSDNWGTFLAWKDLAGVEHRWALPDDLLQGQGREYAQILARGGYSIAPGQAAKFAAFIQGVRTERFVTCVPRIGWHRGAYVLPDTAYGVPADTVVLQSARHAGMFRPGGTPDGWKEIPSLCAGNSRLVFALCVAFAGPLLRLSGLEGGGFSLEGGSSSGKTTALQVAASVWGGPEHVRSWRTTDNALEGMAALHNDNLLILDEVGQVGASVLAESAYMLANGQAKSRAGREGNMRRVLTWRLLFLSSGELGLADKLAENGLKSRGGQEVRFVGLPVDKGMVTELHGLPDAGAVVDRIRMLCAEHHGHAGRAFLQWLCPRHEEVGKDIRENLAEIVSRLCPPEATEQVRRVGKRFALVLGAGLAAQQAGLLPPDMEIMPAVQSCLDDWLTARGGTGASEDAAILAAVRLFIEQHGTSRFQDVDNPNATCINRVGFRRKVEDETEFLILPEAFRAEVVKGYSERRAARVLADNGWLHTSSDGRLKCERRLPGMGKTRAYILTMPEDAESA